MKSIILFETNEIPFRVFEKFAQDHPNSSISKLLSASTQFTGRCDDETELDPWISWPTLHRGVNDNAHRIYHLGQDTKIADARYPPIWEILASTGLRVGLCGSIHSNNLPANLNNYDFYLPDFFDHQIFAKPASLITFQNFNIGMTRRSGRNVDTAVPRNLFLDFARSIPDLGLRPRTYGLLLKQIILERWKPHLKLRRRSLQALIMMDVFLNQHRRSSPQFATFYTNHVAAAMHRYWAATFPNDPEGTRMPIEWVRQYAPEIDESMKVLDVMAGALLAHAQKTDAIVVAASSMGQEAVDRLPASMMVTIVDIARFFIALGLDPANFSARPAMAPCVAAQFDPSVIDVLRAGLNSVSITGERFEESDQDIVPMSFGIAGNFVSLFVLFNDFEGERVVTINGVTKPFEEAGIGNVPHDDGVSVTGNHTRDGVVLIYNLGSPAVDFERTIISTTELMPAILKHFDIDPPAYCASPSPVLTRAFVSL